MRKLLPHVVSRSKISEVPVYLIHFVTSRCNARCPHCFIFAEDDPRFDKKELSLEDITRMTRSLGRKIYNVNITGGEIFVRKDIPQICEAYIKNSGVQVIQLFTNAYFEDRVFDCMEYLSGAYPHVNFVMATSIDDLHDAHDTHRGLKDGFNKALRTYERVRDLRRPNVDLDIGVTISHANQDRLDDIYEFLIKERKYRTISCALVRGNTLDPGAKEVDLSRYRRFSERIDAGVKSGELDCFKGFAGADLLNAKSIVMRKLIENTVAQGFQSDCYAGRLSGVIYSNGDVYPCETLETPIGNLRDFDMSMPALWASAKAKELRDRIWDTKCHCTHECFMTANVLFNPRFYPKLLWEYSKIKLSVA